MPPSDHARAKEPPMIGAQPSCMHRRHDQWGFCTECRVDIYEQDAATQARSRHLVPDWLVAGLAPPEDADADPSQDLTEAECPHDMEAVGVTPRHGTQWQCRRCGDLAP